MPISATPACANVQLSHSPLVTWMVSIKNKKIEKHAETQDKKVEEKYFELVGLCK